MQMKTGVILNRCPKGLQGFGVLMF